MTSIQSAPRSPAGSLTGVSAPLRAHAHTRLPQGRGGVESVTDRDRAGKARERAAERLREAEKALSAGNARLFFNLSLSALQKELAAEARHRPVGVAALYEHIGRELFGTAAQVPLAYIEDNSTPGGGKP